MTRVMTAMIALLLLVAALTAQPQPVTLLLEGQFSGQLGTYVSGDTLYCVYSSSVHPSIPSDIILKKSHDGGLNWNSVVVANAVLGLGSPTVSKAGNEIIVSYVSGYERFVACSWDDGITWQISRINPSFESSPFTENVDGEYRTFSLELPYPQKDQDSYLISPESQSMKLPQYLTDQELGTYGMPARFLGTDVYDGIVRTNSDLWIRHAGGGENNNWPTFWGPVITSGTVRVYPDGGSNYPQEDIFRGGLIENAPWLDVPKPDRRYSSTIGPDYYSPDHIVYVEVNGVSCSAWLGQIITTENDSTSVYNSYPADPLGDPIAVNQYAHRDTIWISLGGTSLMNRNVFVHSELWIKGSFASHQVWNCGSEIKIVGDILLLGTPAGADPSHNMQDSVTLCSDKNVLIKYGYRHPVDGLRYHMANDDNHPLYVYANIMAYGHPWWGYFTGMFSFEYIRPHPSVPASFWQGQLWDNIDLHRRTYPQTPELPWPPYIDYPWYNPLWPEARPYLERGKLQIWGSVLQRRRGAMHHNYLDTEYPYYMWDMDLHHYGGSSSPAATTHIDPVLGFELGTQNYPGATGTGVGYKKDHRNDPRSIFGNIEQGNAGPLSESTAWNLGILVGYYEPPGPGTIYDFIEQDLARLQQVRKYRSKAFARRGSKTLYAFNERLLYMNGLIPSEIGDPEWNGGDILGLRWLNDELALVHRYEYDAVTEPRYLEIMNPTMETAIRINPPGGSAPFPEDSVFSDILVTPGGTAYFGRFDPEFNTLRLWSLGADQLFTLTGQWDINRIETTGPGPGSKLVLRAGTDDQVDAFICWQRADDIPESYDWDRVYHCRIDPATSENSDPIPPTLLPSISVYPNPARADLTLDIKGVPDQQINAEIYNIRGQKVASLHDFEPKGDGSLICIWDGCDASGKRLPPGVYLIRFKAGKTLFVKRVSLY